MRKVKTVQYREAIRVDEEKKQNNTIRRENIKQKHDKIKKSRKNQ